MKFNSSILFCFVVALMTMFICAQSQDDGCKIKVYSPRRGAKYQFNSWQYIDYSVSSSCITGRKGKIDVAVISRASGEKVLDVVRNGNLVTAPRRYKFWIDPSWANDGSEYYVRITINKNMSGKSGYFTTFE